MTIKDEEIPKLDAGLLWSTYVSVSATIVTVTEGSVGGVEVGVAESPGTGVAVEVDVGVGLGVDVLSGVGVGVAESPGTGVAVEVDVGVGLGVGVLPDVSPQTPVSLISTQTVADDPFADNKRIFTLLIWS